MDPSTMTNEIRSLLGQSDQWYHRLIFLLLPGEDSIESQWTLNFSDTFSIPLINVGVELSEKLLDIGGRERSMKVQQLMTDIIQSRKASQVMLRRIEVLFDRSLRLDPLALLQMLSRNTTLLVVWPGDVSDDHLLYATPDHREYKKYPAVGLQILSIVKKEDR